MKPRECRLRDGRLLRIREAVADDARALLDHVHCVSGESDFLGFGPGEFDLTLAEEEQFLRACHESANQIYLLGTVEDALVATLHFSAGRRPRVRHSGELSMAVRKSVWALGVGSRMLDALIDWARNTEVVTKINLRVRTDNEHAIRLYASKGFVREGTPSGARANSPLSPNSGDRRSRGGGDRAVPTLPQPRGA